MAKSEIVKLLKLDLRTLACNWPYNNQVLFSAYVRRTDRRIEQDLMVLDWLENSKDKASDFHFHLQCTEVKPLKELIAQKKRKM